MSTNNEDFTVEINASLINEIFTIFNESVIQLPKKYVVGVEQALLKARHESMTKHQHAKLDSDQKEKEQDKAE